MLSMPTTKSFAALIIVLAVAAAVLLILHLRNSMRTAEMSRGDPIITPTTSVQFKLGTAPYNPQSVKPGDLGAARINPELSVGTQLRLRELAKTGEGACRAPADCGSKVQGPGLAKALELNDLDCVQLSRFLDKLDLKATQPVLVYGRECAELKLLEVVGIDGSRGWDLVMIKRNGSLWEKIYCGFINR